MSDGTKIEWTDATWNVVNGCSVVSPGCTNCYAMRLAGMRLKHHPSREGLTIDTKAGPVWSGEVRFNDKVLLDPLHWRRPRKIFVCAHGDLFHENVPDEWIDRVFAVMALAPQHVFQVLTKRPERMRAYVTAIENRPDAIGQTLAAVVRSAGLAKEAGLDAIDCWEQPLPNVWLGVSAEDQKRYDERVWQLRATPAAVRWLSCEPLIGPIDLGTLGLRLAKVGPDGHFQRDFDRSEQIHWVVAGGESGPGARPMHPDWARSLRDQCAAAHVPFLFKQWGDWWSLEQAAREWGHSIAAARDYFLGKVTETHALIGKKKAGRLLDGVQHDGYPA